MVYGVINRKVGREDRRSWKQRLRNAQFVSHKMLADCKKLQLTT